MIMLDLPLSLSANRIWRRYRNRIVLSDEAEAYKTEAGLIARRAMRDAGYDEPFTHPLETHVLFYMERRNGDVDNRLKLLNDALNGVVWEDDLQIVETHLYRLMAAKPKRGPRLGKITLFVFPAQNDHPEARLRARYLQLGDGLRLLPVPE